jgi:Na+/H+ antiporter NhaC
MEHGILSLLPPLLAIFLAITTRNVVASLFIGIFSGHFILASFNPITAFISMFDSIIALFAEGWIVKTLIFSILVGAVLKLVVDSGGVAGFVHYLTEKQKTIKSKTGALLLAYIIGLIIFIESSITALIAGAISRPLTDRFGVSREKLAYVCDSTSAPVCSLIPFNAWGALLIGLITEQVSSGIITGNPTSLLFQSIPFNFYAIVALLLVLYIIFTGNDFGPMKSAEQQAPTNTNDAETPMTTGNMWHMLLPLSVLVIMMPIGLYYSGGGDLFNGSGSTSVFYAVIVTLLFSFFYYWLTKAMSIDKWFNSFYRGMSDMLPIVMILILAFSISNVAKTLETGQYLASIASDALPVAMIPMVIFLLSGIIAFSTGTSWGTFSLMMPISIAFSVATGADLTLSIAAVVSGGIFGDHCSPISDTTIISSMATRCDHISHVNTQLPYALTAGLISALLFLLAGIFL